MLIGVIFVWLLKPFYLFSSNVLWPLSMVVFCECIHWDLAPHSTYWLVMIFCCGLHLLYEDFSLRRSKNILVNLFQLCCSNLHLRYLYFNGIVVWKTLLTYLSLSKQEQEDIIAEMWQWFLEIPFTHFTLQYAIQTSLTTLNSVYYDVFQTTKQWDWVPF